MRLALKEPRLLAHLVDLDAFRMHVISFFLACRGDEADDNRDAALLGSGRSREILKMALDRSTEVSSPAQEQSLRRLPGLLRRLPDSAVSPLTYKRLATLASNELLAQAMMKIAKIDRLNISRLSAVSPALLNGPLLRAIGGDLNKLAAVAETNDWFIRRWSIDTTERFAAIGNFTELRRLTTDLVYSLPPVPRMAPRVVGSATMIESVQALKRAGREGRNCLGQCTHKFATNSAAFYIWDDGKEPIYIEVSRSEGLGWFLSDMKLAGNKRPPDERWELVDRAFNAAGIDWEAVALNLTSLMTGSREDPW